MQAPGLHIIQYYNIYKTLIRYKDDDNINIKTIYIEDLLHHVGRWLMRKNLIRVKITFNHP